MRAAGIDRSHRTLLYSLAFVLPLVLGARRKVQKDSRLQITNVLHHPCWLSPVEAADSASQLRSPPPGIRVAMVNSDATAPLVDVWGRPGCYYLNSTVAVVGDKAIRSDLQVYVELRFALTEAALEEGPERCRGYDETTGCGGFGSCAYCDRCEELAEKADERKHSFVFRLHRDGERMRCGDTLEPGAHDNVKMRFCLPSERQFFELLRDHEINSRTAKDWLEHRGGTQYAGTVHMNMFIYDTNVAPAVASQRDIERVLTRNYADPLPMRAYKNMPFTKYIFRQLEMNQQDAGYTGHFYYIGCHKFSGTLLVNIDKDDERFLDSRARPQSDEQQQPRRSSSGGGGGKRNRRGRGRS